MTSTLRMAALIVGCCVPGCLCGPLLPMHAKDKCSGDEACLDGYFCNALGECQRGARGEDGPCTVGQTYCDGDSVVTCGEDGYVTGRSRCQSTQVCVDGSCSDNVICSPNARSCVGNTPYTCSADGTALSAGEDCGSAFCVDGSCVIAEHSCPPDAAYCQGGSAYQCNADGTAVAASEACGDQLCVNGSCQPRVCQAGVADCDGQVARTCNALGTGFVATESCAPERQCVLGRCRSLICEPGTQCDEDTLVVCNPQGTEVILSRDCAPGVCQGAQCVMPDAGVPDATTPDHASADAAGPDSGSSDAGGGDAAAPDSSAPDHASSDTGGGCVDDSHEPNDSIASATPLTSGAQVDGVLCTGQDVFELQVPANHTADVVLHLGVGAGDLDLELLNAAGTSLDSSESSTNTETVHAPVTGTAATYYATVYGFSSAQGPYQIELSVAPLPCPDDDGFEPNDQSAAASPLTLPVQESGLAMCDDADWFSFVWPAYQLVVVELDADFAQDALKLVVQDADGGYSRTITASASQHSLTLPLSSSQRSGLIQVAPATAGQAQPRPYGLVVRTEASTLDCPGGQLKVNGSCTPWQTEALFTTSDFPGATAIALDSDGLPSIAVSDSGGVGFARDSTAGWQQSRIGLELGMGGGVSLALDAGDSPHLAISQYFYHRMMYAYRDAGGWQTETVDDGQTVHSDNPPILLIDDQQKPNIFFATDDYGNDLRWAVRDTAWSQDVIDQGVNRPQITGAALDSLGRPHVTYRKDINSVPLYHGYHTTAGWELASLGSTAGHGNGGGWLALDDQDRLHLCYLGGGASSSGQYAFFDGTSWTVRPFGDASTGSCQLVLDAQQQPHIVYVDSFNRDVVYVRWVGGAWQSSVVADAGQNLSPALTLDAAGHAHIVYRHNDDADSNAVASSVVYATW